MTEAPPTTLRFATTAYSDRDRVEAWRDLFGHTICGLDIEPLRDRPFGSETMLRAMPGLGVASGVCSGAHYWRSAQRINSDDFIFVFNHAGHDLARMDGREETIAPGQAVLFAIDRVGGTTNAGVSRFTTLRIPHTAIAGADDFVLRPVAPDNGALRLLGNYLSVLADAQALATAQQQRQVVSHIYDLIEMAVRPAGVKSHAAEHGGLAAARLHAIKRDVARNALEPDLTISSLAARHRLTARYVQMLFAQGGTNFSDYVRLARLAAAHRMLSEPASRGRSISDIALGTGFGNVSYFNRAFRHTFNATPSDVRAAADALSRARAT